MAKPGNITSASSDTKHIFPAIFGMSGIGKTRLVGTSCDIAEKGVLILKPPTEHTQGMRPEDKFRAEVWTMRDHSDMADAHEFLRHEGGKHYDWVWFDSATIWSETGLDDIWADVIAEKPHRAKYGLDKGEYFVNMERIGRIVRSLVGLDEFNFGWTAHRMMGDSPDDQSPIWVPQIPVKGMWSKFSGYMNLVAYYEKKEIKSQAGSKRTARVLRTEMTGEYFAQNKFTGAFPNDRIIDPDMKKIVDAINSVRKTTTTRRRPTGKKAAMARRRAS